MGNFCEGEVWFVEFPLEENQNQTINRPVVVLDEDSLGVLSVKITKHAIRKEDPYDTLPYNNRYYKIIKSIPDFYIRYAL